MLKNIIRDILIVSGIALLFISTSTKCMEWISDRRNDNNSWYGAHETNNGDLVRMSYLDFIGKYCTKLDYSFVKPMYDGPANIDLYIQGDSYIFKVPDSAYAGIHTYHFAWRFWKDLHYHLDTSKKNILIIEISERYMRSYFSNLDIFRHVYDTAKQTTMLLPENVPGKNIAYADFGINGFHLYQLFNPNINQNLEYNLFDYNFITPVIQAKAAFNYYVFGRASGDVMISDNKDYLLLSETADPYKTGSSYSPLTRHDISMLVNNMNRIYDHYKAAGFNEIYLSIIPNPVTILQPDGYNHLIPLIEQNPMLKMKVIDIYNTFTKTNEKIYRPGDTHWNNNGLQIWLSKINNLLVGLNNQPAAH